MIPISATSNLQYNDRDISYCFATVLTGKPSCANHYGHIIILYGHLIVKIGVMYHMYMILTMYISLQLHGYLQLWILANPAGKFCTVRVTFCKYTVHDVQYLSQKTHVPLVISENLTMTFHNSHLSV